MEVILAGMNIDVETIREFRQLAGAAAEQLQASPPDEEKMRVTRQALTDFVDRRDLTPETLSAAYARISRDPRPITALRAEARQSVDRARKSNETIIFGLGHASVAEHAVFNLDILGVSRLAAEFVEHFRLCSYTEKSQRYVTLEGDFVTPLEILGTPLEKDYQALIREQNETYACFTRKLHDDFLARNPSSEDMPGNRRAAAGHAKEDARYCLPLATETQLGMTANARNLERIIQKALVHPLLEVREFGSRLFRAVREAAPSLIRYTEPEAYHRFGLPLLREKIRKALEDAELISNVPAAVETSLPACHLMGDKACGEEAVFAALAHEVLNLPLDLCRCWAAGLDQKRKQELLATLIQHLEPYQSLPRAFELASVTFECIVSASCFAQLKRHRMGSLLAQGYDPGLGITIPPSVRDAGLEERLAEIARRAGELYARIADIAPAAAAYVLTNAHRRRVILQLNLRELTHFARLRLDCHAQWEIRELAGQMVAQVQARMPVLGNLLCGKDELEGVKKGFFNGEYAPEGI